MDDHTQGEVSERVRRIASECAGSWVRAMESMTGEQARAETDWEASPQPVTSWWEHQFKLPEPGFIWIGADASCSEAVGREILESAGIHDSSSEEIQSTFLEVVTQTLSEWAGRIAGITGRAVTYEGVYQLASPDLSAVRFAIVPKFAGRSGHPIFVALPPELIDSPAPQQDKEALLPLGTPPLDMTSGNASTVRQSRTLDLLLEVELPVSVSFGRARLPLKDVLKLTSGAIVELNRSVNDPVEVIVNNCVIARGEVVVVDGYYGIRIHQIVSRQERLRSLN
jgi:flagellar motor switch protein FliN/FliY